MDKNNLIKKYTNGEITVVWQPSKCIHSENCEKNNPDVFKPQDRPWIKLENSSTEKIIETISKCPSGALSYYRTEEGHFKLYLEYIAKISVLVLGIAYASGFLVVITFLDQYGIRETGTEFFRLKYIYIGLFSLVFPGASAALAVGLNAARVLPEFNTPAWTPLVDWFRRRWSPSQNRVEEPTSTESNTDNHGLPLPSKIVFCFLILDSFLILAFAHPGYYSRHHLLIEMLYASAVLILLVRPVFGQLFHGRAAVVIRWVLALVSLLISVLIVKDIDFQTMIKERIYDYLFLVLLFGLLVFTLTMRRLTSLDSGDRRAKILLRCVILSFIYLFTVFSFAHTVYNHIPAEKGGGDFTAMPDARICFMAAEKNSIPPEIANNEGVGFACSVPLKIIEETSSVVFVARSDDRGSFSYKEAPVPAVLWRSGQYRPMVFGLNKTAIASIMLSNKNVIQSGVAKDYPVLQRRQK